LCGALFTRTCTTATTATTTTLLAAFTVRIASLTRSTLLAIALAGLTTPLTTARLLGLGLLDLFFLDLVLD
ncbi:hypothetical protein DXF91_24940, partial [Enterobacter roggenkampii]|uniref:hypothetical protein n=1 Tax=Enterobacter roggenkampii TaxID=1812935 RepID=UPI000E2B97D5